MEEFICKLKRVMLMVQNEYSAEDYTRPKEGETLTRCGTVFFVNPQEFWGRTTLVLGLLKLEFHSDSTKNTSLDITFVS